jgi:FlaA1/EpsC-like NDP-sugar epimerase
MSTPAAAEFNTPLLPQPLQPSATSQSLLQRSVSALPASTPKVLHADVPVRVLITGAARGIGLELTRQYAAANPKNVVFAGVRDVHFDRIAALAKQHRNITIVELDVSSEASVKASLHCTLTWCLFEGRHTAD